MKDWEYLNETVFCRIAPSPIHGVGLFAIRDIPRGKRFWYWDLGRYNLTEKQLNLLVPEVRNLILDLYPFPKQWRWTLSPNASVLQAYINHSDTPNSRECVALRDIKAGEEITEDYQDLGGEPHSISIKHFESTGIKLASVVY